MPEPTESVEADTAFGKFKISSANINTLATIVTLILVSVIAYVINAHAGDAKETGKAVAQELKEANKEVAATIKESNREISKVLNDLAGAMREANCLAQYETAQEKAKNADICKRISH